MHLGYLTASLWSLDAAPATARCEVPEAAPLSIEVVDAVSSGTANPGDEFHVRLAQPLIVNGRVVLSADIPGIGQVVHAMKHKTGGRAGELILAVRYLSVGNVQVPVRGFRINATGREIVGRLLVQNVGAFETREGLETTVPAGTTAGGKVAKVTLVPCAASE